MLKKAETGKVIKRAIIGVLALAVAGGIFFGLRYYMQLQEYKKRIEGIVISRVDLSNVRDGSYRGSFDAIFVGAEVVVQVKNHTIERIDLVKHKNERGAKAEAIVDKIISEQSVTVDVISGATNSSKVILKAVENALESQKDNQ
ncbi:FMN-binding protein [Ruminiclostridium cellobioparum]|uniref:FMN-binding domain-containing protein n=1 Tax=Ruminiclostridium cellobioparum subsp. termitidis CT1112 TaxID=1195236 RepID=S0FXB1_RUMCE|nr:FMN-binding protein [Ruminiclostridium cellobioparum]EMS73218.1 hypothetical protein CTER_0904 [Ruminiclostridium cellobioparum subsp. termitidis CT1112]